MKIAVGTTSEQKLGYLQEILDDLDIKASLLSCDVPSGVSDQPISSDETKTGSMNRAKSAMSKANDADIAMGIEVGYHPDDNGDYEMFCWVSIITKDDKCISAQSHKLLLPPFHQDILKTNQYIGDHVQRFLAENPDNESQEIGNIIRFRKPFIEAALRSTLKEYLKISDKHDE